MFEKMPDLVDLASKATVHLTMLAGRDSLDAVKLIGHLSSSSNDDIIDAIFKNDFLTFADEALHDPEF